ncbi:MAG: class I SAM-dependent methyltransferase family protein [Thermoproteota archaeon]
MDLKRFWGLRVERRDCERLLEFLRERNLVAKGARFKRIGSGIAVPIERQLTAEETASLALLGIRFEGAEEEFELQEARPRSLHDILLDKLPPHLLASVPRAYDVIGDIVVLELPDELKGCGALVGEAALEVNKRARLVLNKTSDISGKFRVGGYEVIAGKGPTETLHREHGCVYKLDPTKVFFTPRLSAERARVASQVKRGEVVADLFAGVGPFSILIAKKVPDAKVFSVDANPFAIAYLEENVRLNRVEGRVTAILGDAGEVAGNMLRGKCSRVVMNLPAGSELFLEAASSALLQRGGVVHMHVFVEGRESVEGKVSALVERFKELGWGKAEASGFRIVREVGKRSYHVAADIILAGRLAHQR